MLLEVKLKLSGTRLVSVFLKTLFSYSGPRPLTPHAIISMIARPGLHINDYKHSNGQKNNKCALLADTGSLTKTSITPRLPV